MDIPLDFQRKALTKIRKPHSLILIAIFFLAVAARLLPGPRTIDDSYITFRYARNILAGNGFSYNPGEHVLGTTTPLYTILLTGFGSILGGVKAPFAELAMVINAFADGLTCLLLAGLGKRFGAYYAGVGAALVWAIAPFSVTFAIGGLETSLYILLLTATFSAHLREQHIPAALLAALAYLTRPDALLLILPLALDRFWQIYSASHAQPSEQSIASARTHQESKLAELVAFGVPVLSWVLFSTIYFGSPIPHSIAAKSLAYRLPASAALVRLIQHYTTPFLEHLTFGTRWISVGLVLYPFLFIVGALHTFRIDRHTWAFLVFPWLYFAAFAIANPLIFRWYLTPPLPALILIILVGVERVLRIITASFGNINKQKYSTAWVKISTPLVIFFVALLPFALSLRGWTLHPDHGINRPAPQMAWYQLELLYQQAAATIIPELSSRPPDPVIAAGDVGVLGFMTNARILDTVGLNSPQSVKYYPIPPAYYTINYAIPPDLILDNHPDFIVILEVYGREGLLKDPRFQATYRLRQKIPTDIYGSDGMLIFERVKQ